MHKISFMMTAALVVFAVSLPMHGAMAVKKGLGPTIKCECAKAGVCDMCEDENGHVTCQTLKGNSVTEDVNGKPSRRAA